ncbi:MAG: hypothetical protein DRI24_00015 [Deltaproteobacteria bacterium]|nr:MAG: hypothetical protein DRI24_00015 [Deltaproteobacteria bacterium]
MKLSLKILSEAEKLRIHGDSLKILGEIGVKFMTDNYNEIRPSFTSLIHSSKHIQNELHHPDEVPFLIEGLAAILGSEDAVKQRKIFSVCYCTIPPLSHDRDMCDAYLELVKFHVPALQGGH